MTAPEKGHPGPSCSDFDLEQESGFSYSRIDGVPRKVERLGRAKAYTQTFVDYALALEENQGACSIYDKLASAKRCADPLVIQRWPGNDHYAFRSFFCHRHLLCLGCAIQRGSRELSRAMQRIELMGGLEDRYSYMLTMTIKNGPDLAERYDHLTRSLHFLRQARRSRKHATSFNLISGAMSSLEFKRGKDSLWHPHVHMFITSESELPVVKTPGFSDDKDVWRWPALSEEWKRITGDSYILECHPVHADSELGLIKPLCEIFKYAVKVNQLDHVDRLDAYRALTGRRLLSTIGDFYGVGIDSPVTKFARKEKLEGLSSGDFDVLTYDFRGDGYSLKDQCFNRLALHV